MSKAKELAREVISQMEEIQRQVMNNNSLSGFTNDWQSGFNHAMIELRNRLNDAVLSEPEPEPLRGWIEVEAGDRSQGPDATSLYAINVNHLHLFTSFGEGTILSFEKNAEIAVKESYDSIKQKIRGAS